MREPVEKITGCDSSTICSQATAKTKVPVKKRPAKSTGKSSRKPTRRVELDSSSESEDGNGEGDEEVQLPPSKLTLAGKQGRDVQFAPVKKPAGMTGKSSRWQTGRVEQESSGESEDLDEAQGDEEIQLSTSKLTSVGKRGRAVRSVPVEQPPSKLTGRSSGKLTGRVEQELSSEGEFGDEGECHEGVQSQPSKLKSIRKRGRAVQSDSEQDSCLLVKKAKPNVIRRNKPLEDNAGTPSAESSSNLDRAPLPSNDARGSRLVGPASAIQMKETRNKIPAPEQTAPSTTQATGKKAKRDGAQVHNPEPKQSTKTAKMSYKVNYMQRE
ncbi:uncharacterized protein F5147DRAFT_775344 [Suillus discolor]|uniref:Uncharacterized protein n=1 Tax=Suillus discolor TaxID=1912936 RepID=A0A9P7F2T3_9AGAM|nr:uncharacterized protein F5147DRAFT_775344 [Suillus discolor]KAG2105024.1 hypothetical protein F5147DRAFT_775344 [Suillus discolor]